MKIKEKDGITLIALVITIIVLLILAGVSIALLTGENGILTKATIASEDTKKAGALEKVKIAVAESFDNNGKFKYEDFLNNVKNVEGFEKIDGENVIVDGTTIKVDPNTGRATIVTSEEEETGTLPSTENTKPYLPSNDFSKVEGTDLNTGLVIKDKEGNSYVWVEVPKNIFSSVTSNTDYLNIETDMQTYALNYRKNGWIDEWYDGCGLTQEDYNNQKNKMLESVYDNGGFWISQYEIGTDTLRTSNSQELSTLKCKEDIYPYNYISIEKAQDMVNKMDSGNYISSLLYGIQWDLILKYLEVRGVNTESQLKVNSTEYGNYKNSTFNITKGKYSLDNKVFTSVSGAYTKPASTAVLMTTGVSERNSALNIYDLGGNLEEWTLEKNTSSFIPATIRGGYYNTNGNSTSFAYRNTIGVFGGYYYIGIRVALY